MSFVCQPRSMVLLTLTNLCHPLTCQKIEVRKRACSFCTVVALDRAGCGRLNRRQPVMRALLLAVRQLAAGFAAGGVFAAADARELEQRAVSAAHGGRRELRRANEWSKWTKRNSTYCQYVLDVSGIPLKYSTLQQAKQACANYGVSCPGAYDVGCDGKPPFYACNAPEGGKIRTMTAAQASIQAR